MNGEPLTVRLPLAVDRELRQRAGRKGTSPQRYLVALVTRALGASADRPVTMTVTGPSDLIAALAANGVLTVGRVDPPPHEPLPPPPEPQPPCTHPAPVEFAGGSAYCGACQARRQADGTWA
jgi:hypothetical protein